MKIILASASAGRKKILESLGLPFIIIPADIDERKITASNPIRLIKKIAKEKAKTVFKQIRSEPTNFDRLRQSERLRVIKQLQPVRERFEDGSTISLASGVRSDIIMIIAADSMVLFKGKTYGKPKDKTEAKKFLGILSGQTHEFITGLCVIYFSLDRRPLSRLICKSCKSEVTFEKFTKEEIEKYIKIAYVTSFAGGFAPNLKGGEIIKPKMHIKGSVSNVLGGLPLEILLPILKQI